MILIKKKNNISRENHLNFMNKDHLVLNNNSKAEGKESASTVLGTWETKSCSHGAYKNEKIGSKIRKLSYV